MNPCNIVAAGHAHSLVVMPEGDVYQFGDSGDGRPSREPAIISGLPPIASVAAGNFFSLFVDLDGNVWGMGHSHYGELGFSGTCTEPQQIKFEEDVKIKMVAASRNYYSVFLDEDGSVWTSGYNVYGQLGLGNFDNTSTPKKIENIPKMSSISAGHYHTLLLDENGEVWTCGYNEYGQLGRPTDMQQMCAENAAKMPSPVKFKSVSAGNYHSMFLDVEGRVWGCGHNRDASLALPHTNYADKAVSAGNYHSMFLDVEGRVWGSGTNRDASLALPHTNYVNSVEMWPEKAKIRFISAGNYRTLLIDEEGDVWYAGKGVKVPRKIKIEGSTWDGFAACEMHHLVVDTRGQVWVWGENSEGQLGLGQSSGMCEALPVVNNLLPPIRMFGRTKSARK